ncbi:MAG: hypothetical protein AAFR91_00175 [Pseudomonadota bacterium]
MEISTYSMPESIPLVMERSRASGTLGPYPTPSATTGQTTEQISPLGSLAGTMPALNADQQEELSIFRGEMRAALTSGSFDAAEMAGKAPQFMQQHAADKGVSLEAAFQQLGDRVNSLQGLKSGLSVVGYSDLSPGQNDLMQSLLTALGED